MCVAAMILRLYHIFLHERCAAHAERGLDADPSKIGKQQKQFPNFHQRCGQAVLQSDLPTEAGNALFF